MICAMFCLANLFCMACMRLGLPGRAVTSYGDGHGLPLVLAMLSLLNALHLPVPVVLRMLLLSPSIRMELTLNTMLLVLIHAASP